MQTYWLCFTLLSDATFGQGEGVAGLVDQDVAHDQDGFPYLKGRTLKGLLNEECANLLYTLERQARPRDRWIAAAQRLFGGSGSTLADTAQLHVGRASLPADLRQAVRQTLQDPEAALTSHDVLDSLTDIRRQTAVDEATGAPEAHTLRAMRVILRQTPFQARLTFAAAPVDDDLALLAACILATRRVGTGRNRGRGRVQTTLHLDHNGQPGDDVTAQYFAAFAQEVHP